MTRTKTLRRRKTGAPSLNGSLMGNCWRVHPPAAPAVDDAPPHPLQDETSNKRPGTLEPTGSLFRGFILLRANSDRCVFWSHDTSRSSGLVSLIYFIDRYVSTLACHRVLRPRRKHYPQDHCDDVTHQNKNLWLNCRRLDANLKS